MSPVKSPQELSTPDIGKKDKLVVQKGEEELPPGWEVEVKTRKGVNGIKKDRYYTDPATGYIFRSLVDVHRYLKTGDVGRRAKKPKITETDKKIVEQSESKEQTTVSSSPLSETPINKRPLEESKSELPQRASKRLPGPTIDAPPPPPPPSPPEPKTRKARRLSGNKIDAPPPLPPPPSPPVPKTRQAKRKAAMEIEAPLTTQPEPKIRDDPTPPPPLPPSSPPEPKTSHQVTARQAEEAQTRPPVVLAISKEKGKKAETQKIKDNDGIRNADMASKRVVVTQESLEKVKSKAADENQKPHTALPEKQPVESGIPMPMPIPIPIPIPIPMADSHSYHKKQESPVTNMNPSQESSINFCLNDFWTDPCIEFAVKTLTGAIPFGELNKVDNFPASSPLEVPMEELWTDPCIEFAVKTLTGAIPVVGEQDQNPGNGIQDYLHHQPTATKHFETGNNNNNVYKQLDSVGNSGLQKSGNIGFHQQVNGSNNGQCSRPRFFQ